MYGYEIPRGYKHALELDKINKNYHWHDCTILELGQLDKYKPFWNIGKNIIPGEEYKQIRVHFFYAVKHDGRHKTRLVTNRNLTEVPVSSVYSGVVFLKGLRIMVFLLELNELNLWGTNIGNAYLEAFTSELVYIIVRAEFGDLEGCTLIIVKALYGPRTSGARWHESSADVLKDMNFVPSQNEPDIWMRENGSDTNTSPYMLTIWLWH